MGYAILENELLICNSKNIYHALLGHIFIWTIRLTYAI